MSTRSRIAWVGCVLSLLTMACARRGPKPAALGAVVPAEVAALAAAEQRHEYRIQAGDELHVRFLYHPDMSEQLPVRPDGRISLLSTGEVLAVGLTPTELERLIAERSSSRLREPEVTVVVTRLAEQRVYVGGEVGKPGYVTLQPEMTPLQAILHSGGFRRTAKLDSVLLLTPQPGGQFSAARVDIAQVVNDGVPERVRVHPGSVVYVPANWIGDMNAVVDLYVRGLIPVLPRVGAGYSINQSN